MLLAVALACTEPPPSGTGPDDEGTTWTTGHTGGVTSPPETAHTGVAGHTGHTGAPTGCDALPPHPLDQGAFDIATTEDFDFDARGPPRVRRQLRQPHGRRPVRLHVSMVSPGGWYSDARGVQVLSTGEIAVNYIGGNRIGEGGPRHRRPDRPAHRPQGPNALEVGVGDVLYFTEAYANQPRVGVYDPRDRRPRSSPPASATRTGSRCRRTSSRCTSPTTPAGIYAVEGRPRHRRVGREGSRVRPGVGEAYDAMEVDVCGNLYSAQFYSGKLYRYDPVTDTARWSSISTTPAASCGTRSGGARTAAGGSATRCT
jgi:hypothetical protein